MYREILPRIETPAVLIDMRKARRNVEKMQQACNAAGVALRPHVKTHKMPEFARMQLSAGAKGITCAKVSEAEVMADGGCRDIFIAYPMVGDFRVTRAMRLASRVDRLILAADSVEGAVLLDKAARAFGVVPELRLEVETGARRTGFSEDGLLEAARAVSVLDGLRFTGIYTFRGLRLDDGAATSDNAAAGAGEAEILGRVAARLGRSGFSGLEVSGGSSPTGKWVAESGKVTEIRPGTYIFNDCLLWNEGVADLDEIAALVVVTVVSVRDGYAVIDGGSKVFPQDMILDIPPYFHEGYAKSVGQDGLRLRRVNEEHGILTYEGGAAPSLSPGDKLLFYPGHVCTTINLRNEVYLWDGKTLRVEKVGARGCAV